MKYYLDCEFDGLGGRLVSMAMVSETGKEFYVVITGPAKNQWVHDNVMPILFEIPTNSMRIIEYVTKKNIAGYIQEYFRDDFDICIIADWPDDIKYLCEAMITGPGTMINIPKITFVVNRIDPYPTDLPNAVQHNALWDAQALKYKIEQGETL